MAARVSKKAIEKQIRTARQNVLRTIASSTDRNSVYSRGLAYEGYSGGYLAALDDVMQAFGGIKPSRNGWWDEPTDL